MCSSLVDVSVEPATHPSGSAVETYKLKEFLNDIQLKNHLLIPWNGIEAQLFQVNNQLVHCFFYDGCSDSKN